MIAVRLAMSEIRRVTAGVLPKIAVVALVLVPVLYSATYLYANWDPYQNLSGVKAAIVNEDQPVQSDGKTVDTGAEITANLKDSGTFDFVTTSAGNADAGVKDGTYAFVITIPPGFSANLTSAVDFDPRQAVLKVTTNDANNYLIGTIADKVSSKTRESVAKQVGEQAANKFLLGFSEIHGKLLQATDGATQIVDGAIKLKDGTGQLSAGLAKAADGSTQLVVGQQKLVDGVVALSAGAAQLADGTGQLVAGSTTLTGGTAQLSSGAGELASGLGSLADKTAALPDQTAKLASGAQQVADGNAKIAGVSQQVASTANEAIAGAPAARQQLASQLLAAGLSQAEVDQALSQVDALFAPVQQANTKLQSANDQIQQLADGAAQVADGATKLAGATPALVDGITQAHSGAESLAAGATKVDAGAQQLATGVTQAHAGASKLAEGTGQLAGGQQQALNGAKELSDGVGALQAGAGRLDTGLGDLVGGATQLRDQLAQGAQGVPNPDVSTREATAGQIGDPMTIAQDSIASAGNYGSGLAPFFLGLSLWVGAFTLFLLIKPLSTRALAGRAPVFQTALGGWLPVAALGVVQAIAVYGVGVGLVGLKPAYPWYTLGLLMLTSLAFTAILHGLNAKFGAIGKFLGLLLLILQLVSAGGTFPWETTPAPLHVLHDILPLGYVVDALRHTIYGGPLSPDLPDILMLMTYICLGLALSTWAAASDRSWSLKRLKPELEL